MSIWDVFRGAQPSPNIQAVIRTRIVEVPKPRQHLALDTTTAAAVASLQGHPGFIWLMEKKRLQKAQLQSILAKERHKSLTDVEFLQSGIAWLSWDEEQMLRAINWQDAPAQVEPAQSEQAAFEEIQKFLEVLGGPPKASPQG